LDALQDAQRHLTAEEAAFVSMLNEVTPLRHFASKAAAAMLR